MCLVNILTIAKNPYKTQNIKRVNCITSGLYKVNQNAISPLDICYEKNRRNRRQAG